MRDFDRGLALASEASKNGSITHTYLWSISECRINSILTKASYGMRLEVRSCHAILGILKTADTIDFTFAPHRNTLEEVELAPVIVSNGYLGLEESINRGAPTKLKTFWNETMLEKQDDTKHGLNTPISSSSFSSSISVVFVLSSGLGARGTATRADPPKHSQSLA
jgi:hypothetical protein